jgi:adenosylcobyric acid synthase
VQLGAQSSEVVFLLMTDSAVRAVIDSPGQFGIGAQATFGELGGGGSTGTTLQGSDIVGFTKGSGVFLGAAFSGAYIEALQALNQSYYRASANSPGAILLQHQVSNPGADALRQALAVARALAVSRALMFQGTGSDVGKSLIVAGLARAYVRRGLAVRPFKPQNMSNNAAVTADGGEIGRAQALQARACGVPPTTDMNPVLLKPQSEIGAQVVVQGRILGTAKARDYQALKPCLLPRVLESFARLAAGCDLLLVEGAGSPAEVNLRAGDIANMGFAEAAGVPVVLVADIDRGGVIASVVGTWTVLHSAERARLGGYLINKFRGDASLFDDGLQIIAGYTGLPCFGVVPWFEAARLLPAEDAVALDRRPLADAGRPIRVAVPRLPRIANFDDLDPLLAEPDVAVTFVGSGEALPGDADVIVLPGSKATIADLAALRAEGWDVDLAAHLRRGGRIIGLCGGYQMLGARIRDPLGMEGLPTEVPGLGLLDVATELTPDKTLVEATGVELSTGAPVHGYEMHVGRTVGPGCARPMLRLGGRDEGAVSADGRVQGCYLHGLFASDAFRSAFLAALRPAREAGLAYETQVENTLDALADHLAAHLDLDRLLAAAAPVGSPVGSQVGS